MPTYRYRCTACDETPEFFHSMSETRKKCPACGGRLERLIGSGGGVILKGGGFYTTDYRSAGYREAAKKDREAAKPASEGKPKDGAKPKDAARGGTKDAAKGKAGGKPKGGGKGA